MINWYYTFRGTDIINWRLLDLKNDRVLEGFKEFENSLSSFEEYCKDSPTVTIKNYNFKLTQLKELKKEYEGRK